MCLGSIAVQLTLCLSLPVTRVATQPILPISAPQAASRLLLLLPTVHLLLPTMHLLLLLPTLASATYNVGVGRADITGPAAEVVIGWMPLTYVPQIGMMGYAKQGQNTRGRGGRGRSSVHVHTQVSTRASTHVPLSWRTWRARRGWCSSPATRP